MAFDSNKTFVVPDAPSSQELFEPPAALGIDTKILAESFILLKTLRKTPATRKYINSFMPLWSEDILEGAIPEDKLFLISRERIDLDDGSFMFDYTSIEEEEVSIEGVGVEADLSFASAAISYGPKEAERLISLYGNAPVELQITLEEEPLASTVITTNSIQGEDISFNSLSSLGPISQESLTLTVVSDSEGEAIEQREAVITDVGGVTTTGVRRNVGASERIESEATRLGLESEDVFITSGY